VKPGGVRPVQGVLLLKSFPRKFRAFLQGVIASDVAWY